MPKMTFNGTSITQAEPNESFQANTGGINYKLHINPETTVKDLHNQLIEALVDDENGIYATCINEEKDPDTVEYNISQIMDEFAVWNGGYSDTLAFPSHALNDDSFVYITLVV